MRCDSPICRALRAELSGLSPAGRHLLAQVICKFDGWPVGYTAGVLADGFGMSRSGLISARKELEKPRPGSKEGYLTHCELVWDEPRRGRPPVGFMVSMAFAFEIGLANSVGRIASIQETVVRTVLSGLPAVVGATGGTHLGKPAPMALQLPVPARLLLVTLWSFADESGVVSGVGFGALARLLNMPITRLRRQLKRLEEDRYLEYKISGLTGRHVPGKASGVIVLRFLHPDYAAWVPSRRELPIYWAGTGYPRVLFIYQDADKIHEDRMLAESRGRSSGYSEGLARDIDTTVLGRLRISDQPGKEGRDQPFYLYKAFASEPQRSLAQSFLTFKLHEYAACLINHHAQQLVSPDIDMVGQMRDRIERELCSNSTLERVLGKGGADALARWLYTCVHDISSHIVRELGSKLGLTSTELAAEVGRRYTSFQVFPGSRIGEAWVTFAESGKANSELPRTV